MLEIRIGNCQKFDWETIIDPNNSQHFWVNRRDLEIESKRNWQVIFDKSKDWSSQKYRKELTPNITFQPDINLIEFLKLKEKLGLCLYEVIDEQKFISTSEEKVITQNKVENEQLKKENKQLKKNIAKNVTIKESIKKPMEIKSPKEDKNTTDYPNWFDRNKFKNFLAIIDSNKSNYKSKIQVYWH